MELIHFEWSKYQNYVISFFWCQCPFQLESAYYTIYFLRFYSDNDSDLCIYLVGCLIDCILFYVLIKSISSIWKRHHCQCMDFKLRYFLSFLAFEEGGFLLQCTCRNVFFGNDSIWDWPFTISWLRYVADN